MTHFKFAHLTPQQIEKLLDQYYSAEVSVKNLIEAYKIDIHPNIFHTLLDPVKCEEIFCPYCKEKNLYIKRKRQKIGEDDKNSIPFCLTCKHKEDSTCFCTNCRQIERIKKQEIQNEKHKTVINYLKNLELNPPTIEEFTLEDALYLKSIWLYSVSENLQFVHLFLEQTPPLSPTFEFTYMIVQHLYRRGLISISPESSVNAFEFDELNTSIIGYYLEEVKWEFLPSCKNDEKAHFIKKLEDKILKDDNWDYHEFIRIWHLIAKYECIENYLYLIEERNFTIETVGKTTHTVFENLLQHFTVPQIFNLSWQAVRDTSDFIIKKNIPKYIGKNCFIRAIQMKSDKYRANGWELRESKRNFNCCQTVVSSTFFDNFLKLGDTAFNEKLPPLNHE